MVTWTLLGVMAAAMGPGLVILSVAVAPAWTDPLGALAWTDPVVGLADGRGGPMVAGAKQSSNTAGRRGGAVPRQGTTTAQTCNEHISQNPNNNDNKNDKKYSNYERLLTMLLGLAIVIGVARPDAPSRAKVSQPLPRVQVLPTP